MNIATIAPVDLQALRLGSQPVELIDVRTPAEFREVHADFARNVPLDSLDPAALLRSRADAGQPLYVICRSGGRSKQACEKLAAAGGVNVVNVEGGTLAWTAAGLPVVRGPKAFRLGAASSHRRRLARPVGRRARLAGPSGLVRAWRPLSAPA